MKPTSSSERARIFIPPASPCPSVVFLELGQYGLFQVDAGEAGQLKQIEEHVRQFAREIPGRLRPLRPLEMLKHLGRLERERGGEVAGRLRTVTLRPIPTFGLDEAVHFRGQF